jgi:hypothetical protein
MVSALTQLGMGLDAGLAQAQSTPSVQLHLGVVDTVLLFVYFVFVIGIGFALRRAVATSTDFFLSGRAPGPFAYGGTRPGNRRVVVRVQHAAGRDPPAPSPSAGRAWTARS